MNRAQRRAAVKATGELRAGDTIWEVVCVREGRRLLAPVLRPTAKTALARGSEIFGVQPGDKWTVGPLGATWTYEADVVPA